MTSMNIETIDRSDARLPRTPRRPVGQRDSRWIDSLLREVGSNAITSCAAPDRLEGANDPLFRNGRYLRAA